MNEEKKVTYELDPFEGTDVAAGWDESEQDESKDCGSTCIKL